MAQPTSAFLGRLFGGKEPDDYILIWSLQTKKSSWYRNIQQAGVQAQVLSKLGDVYVGVGISPHAYGESLRCPSEDVVGLVGLWADIDVQGPVHKKQHLPPTFEAAVDLCNEMPHAPSLVINSGHGIQAWWLFDTVWNLRSQGERERAKRLSRSWSAHLKGLAKSHGWEVDSVYDLARILRIPGTLNHKEPENLVEVRVLSDSKAQYTVDELERDTPVAATTERSNGNVLTAKEINGIVLNPEVEIDKYAFDLLSEFEPRFAKSFKREHRDDIPENSPSNHDLAIATYAAMAGWPNQKIADLLIVARRENGEDVAKAMRVDYMSHTIGMARDAADKYHGTGAYGVVQESSHTNGRMVESGSAVGEDSGIDTSSNNAGHRSDPSGDESDADQPDEGSDSGNHRNGAQGIAVNGTAKRSSGDRNVGNKDSKPKPKPKVAEDEGGEKRSIRTGPPPKLNEKQIEDVLGICSGITGIKILAVKKYIGTNPSYEVKTVLGDARFKSVNELQNQTAFRNEIFGQSDYLMPQIKADRWVKLMNLLVSVADQSDFGDEGTTEGLMRTWISGYIRTHEPLDDGDPYNDSPFYSGDYVCLYNDHFRRWLSMQFGEKLTYRELGMNFRSINAVPGTIQISLKNGKKTFRPTWKVLESFLTPPTTQKEIGGE